MHVGVKAVHTDRGEESNNELAVSLQHDISSPQPAHSFWIGFFRRFCPAYPQSAGPLPHRSAQSESNSMTSFGSGFDLAFFRGAATA